MFDCQPGVFIPAEGSRPHRHSLSQALRAVSSPLSLCDSIAFPAIAVSVGSEREVRLRIGSKSYGASENKVG